MTETKEKVTISLRLASMFIDHFVMTFIMMLLVMPVFVIQMIDVFELNHDPLSLDFFWIAAFFILGYAVYFNKDGLNGRSPAKRILKMQVINNKTNMVASPLKCLLRNVTIIFWPIEVLFVLVNPKRRIGDLIAGTRIDYVEQPEKVKINWSKFSLALILAVLLSCLIALPFVVLTSKLNDRNIAYVKSSYNQRMSNNANDTFETELSGLLKKADFKVYDEIENSDKKYVAGILYFKSKDDYENYEESEDVIGTLLRSEYPLDSYICFLKFVYKESNSISSREKMYELDVD